MDAARELVLTRRIDVPREKLWRCWTEAQLLKQWFTPPPFTVPHAEMDVRAGGSSLVVMRGPDGKDMAIPGVYLEVVKKERLVFTDAYTKAWEPSLKPFMTAIITFENERGTGRSKTARRTRRWASIPAGASPPTSSRRWRPSSEAGDGAGRSSATEARNGASLLHCTRYPNTAPGSRRKPDESRLMPMA
jgi:uncharacterized protein YndB with AHSA1/START domain